MNLSIIFVHYHTPELLKAAIDAVRREGSSTGMELEIIVVDNGSTAADACLLKSLSVLLIQPGENLGYAGGVNRGVAACTTNKFIIMNPDVMVLPGCLEHLINALQQGAAAAGPRFFADHGLRVMMPPLVEKTRHAELVRRLSVLGEAWALKARRAWRQQARRHWSAKEPIKSYDLVGAMLAIRRDAWEAVGPFDEAFALYYEEMDWLRRLKAHHIEARYVPNAKAIHYFAQSTIKESKADQWFQESTRLFQDRYYGWLFNRCLDWGSRLGRLIFAGRGNVPLNEIVEGIPRLDELPHKINREQAWIELSLDPSGFPAAACSLKPAIEESAIEEPGWMLPQAMWDRLSPGSYTIRLVSPDDHEHLISHFRKLPVPSAAAHHEPNI